MSLNRYAYGYEHYGESQKESTSSVKEKGIISKQALVDYASDNDSASDKEYPNSKYKSADSELDAFVSKFSNSATARGNYKFNPPRINPGGAFSRKYEPVSSLKSKGEMYLNEISNSPNSFEGSGHVNKFIRPSSPVPGDDIFNQNREFEMSSMRRSPPGLEVGESGRKFSRPFHRANKFDNMTMGPMRGNEDRGHHGKYFTKDIPLDDSRLDSFSRGSFPSDRSPADHKRAFSHRSSFEDKSKTECFDPQSNFDDRASKRFKDDTYYEQSNIRHRSPERLREEEHYDQPSAFRNRFREGPFEHHGASSGNTEERFRGSTLKQHSPLIDRYSSQNKSDHSFRMLEAPANKMSKSQFDYDLDQSRSRYSRDDSAQKPMDGSRGSRGPFNSRFEEHIYTGDRTSRTLNENYSKNIRTEHIAEHRGPDASRFQDISSKHQERLPEYKERDEKVNKDRYEKGKLSFDVEREMGPPEELWRKLYELRKRAPSPSKRADKLAESGKPDAQEKAWLERYQVLQDNLHVPPPPPPPRLSVQNSPPPVTDYSQPLPFINRSNSSGTKGKEPKDNFKHEQNSEIIQQCQHKIKELYRKHTSDVGTFFPLSKSQVFSSSMSPLIFFQVNALSFNQPKVGMTKCWESPSVTKIKLKLAQNSSIRKDNLDLSESRNPEERPKNVLNTAKTQALNTQPWERRVYETTLNMGPESGTNQNTAPHANANFGNPSSCDSSASNMLSACGMPSGNTSGNYWGDQRAQPCGADANYQSQQAPSHYLSNPNWNGVASWNEWSSNPSTYQSQNTNYFTSMVRGVNQKYTPALSSQKHQVNPNLIMVNANYSSQKDPPVNSKEVLQSKERNQKRGQPVKQHTKQISPNLLSDTNQTTSRQEISSDDDDVVFVSETICSPKPLEVRKEQADSNIKRRRIEDNRQQKMNMMNQPNSQTDQFKTQKNNQNNQSDRKTLPIQSQIPQHTNLKALPLQVKSQQLSRIQSYGESDIYSNMSKYKQVTQGKFPLKANPNKQSQTQINQSKNWSDVKAKNQLPLGAKAKNQLPICVKADSVISPVGKPENKQAFEQPQSWRNQLDIQPDLKHQINNWLSQKKESDSGNYQVRKSNVQQQQEVRKDSKQFEMKKGNLQQIQVNRTDQGTDHPSGNRLQTPANKLHMQMSQEDKQKTELKQENKKQTQMDLANKQQAQVNQGKTVKSQTQVNQGTKQQIQSNQGNKQQFFIIEAHTKLQVESSSNFSTSNEKKSECNQTSGLNTQKTELQKSSKPDGNTSISNNSDKQNIAKIDTTMQEKKDVSPIKDDNIKLVKDNIEEKPTENNMLKREIQPSNNINKEAQSSTKMSEEESTQAKQTEDALSNTLQQLHQILTTKTNLSTTISRLQAQNLTIYTKVKKGQFLSNKNYFICNDMLCFRFKSDSNPLIITDGIADEIIALLHRYGHGASVNDLIEILNKYFCNITNALSKVENELQSCNICAEIKLPKKVSPSKECIETEQSEPSQKIPVNLPAKKENDEEKAEDMSNLIAKVKDSQSKSEIVKKRMAMFKTSDKFFFKGGLILKKCFVAGKQELKIFIPEDRIEDIINICHSEFTSHGQEASVSAILKKHFSPIPYMSDKVFNFISKCSACKKEN